MARALSLTTTPAAMPTLDELVADPTRATALPAIVLHELLCLTCLRLPNACACRRTGSITTRTSCRSRSVKAACSASAAAASIATAARASGPDPIEGERIRGHVRAKRSKTHEAIDA